MNVGIIGGGPSGMATALLLARGGVQVFLFEKKDRVGKKLLATGNGRCNLSNVDLDLSHFHSVAGGLPEELIAAFDHRRLREFFASLNIDIVRESRGKLYPVTLKASSVLNALRMALEEAGVVLITSAHVSEIKKRGGAWEIVSTLGNYPVDGVVLASGGKTFGGKREEKGSYQLLEALGHHSTAFFPSIAALTLNSPHLRGLSGTKVVGRVRLMNDSGELISSTGEILWAADGISGPPVLDLARKVHEIPGRKWVEFPLINHLEQLPENYREILAERLEKRPLEEVLTGLVDKKWLSVLRRELELDGEDVAGGEAAEALLALLFAFPMEVTGTRGFESAQGSCGGLAMGEFHPHSLESKLLPGIYATGEVLDVDGDCGGYNLHFAWASAHAVAEEILSKSL
ncbi:MAG: aminoacetone oxidase family FAD-binding enzyme [Tissierellia bacterium]|nr:aminoacetone oxidase family FAD-binding enzyme [Tissierellia bacterium]